MNTISPFTAIQKSQTQTPVNMKYRPKKATFIDQFGNEVEGVFCDCMKVGLARDYACYTNYGGPVRTLYMCDDCLEEAQKVCNPTRLCRDRKNISHMIWLCR